MGKVNLNSLHTLSKMTSKKCALQQCFAPNLQEIPLMNSKVEGQQLAAAWHKLIYHT
jgi:hypothetical protein